MADTNTLTALTSMQPGTVSAFGDILKTVMAMNPVVGGVITLVGGLLINNSAKKLKEKADSVPPSIEELTKFKEELKTELNQIKTDALCKFEAAGKTTAERIEISSKDTIDALDKAKIRAMKLKDLTDANLSRLITTEQAIETRVKRLERVHAELVLNLKNKKS